MLTNAARWPHPHGNAPAPSPWQTTFIVREGSHARREWVAGEQNYKKLRIQLEQDGTLAPVSDGSAMVFTRDQVFASPSAAAACVLGRNSNGRLEWRIAGSKTTYREWQERQLDTVTDEAE